MTEKILILTFCILMIVIFSMNFNKKWRNQNYEKLKDRKHLLYWFGVFRIQETKENFDKFYKRLSVFVIIIMTISIILLFTV
jgi:hypothetical protein